MTAAVKSVRYIQDITGPEQTGAWDVIGTDLGIPVYSPRFRRMYFLFGDTFGRKPGCEDPMAGGNWRGTVAGYTDRLDFSDGIRWDGFLADERGWAKALIPAHQTANDACLEVTKISQGGVEVDGTLYVFYESISHWGPEASGYWYLNYGGALKSADGGKTFEKVYDLSWIEPADPEGVSRAKRLIEEDMRLQPSGVSVDAAAHVAPGFGQMYAQDGKDGYLYIYGRPGGRIRGIKAGRVKKEQLERFDAYEYLTGFSGGRPLWLPARQGLDAIMADPDRAELVPGPTSNMTVNYNLYLGRWMLTFYRPGVGICFCLSETPYGPFGAPQVLLSVSDPALLVFMPENGNGNSLYGGFTHEAMFREQGRIVPLVVSQWYGKPGKGRYYGSRLFEIEFA